MTLPSFNIASAQPGEFVLSYSAKIESTFFDNESANCAEPIWYKKVKKIIQNNFCFIVKN